MLCVSSYGGQYHLSIGRDEILQFDSRNEQLFRYLWRSYYDGKENLNTKSIISVRHHEKQAKSAMHDLDEYPRLIPQEFDLLVLINIVLRIFFL